eukprot:CAMPEP_0177640620 /NCGR_PEP_ID=MMETSP0447-20121125/6639_1 /TAXON_ID=0 /ORGANISM="Stygamoeba regulata, Strain BSH-02190019" /LENGTH=209 /DNA_ID=CAMNT_0019142701 /DNA_START=224 /DNA_END=854 /DNA_ORIENTATION=-
MRATYDIHHTHASVMALSGIQMILRTMPAHPVHKYAAARHKATQVPQVHDQLVRANHQVDQREQQEAPWLGQGQGAGGAPEHTGQQAEGRDGGQGGGDHKGRPQQRQEHNDAGAVIVFQPIMQWPMVEVHPPVTGDAEDHKHKDDGGDVRHRAKQSEEELRPALYTLVTRDIHALNWVQPSRGQTNRISHGQMGAYTAAAMMTACTTMV